MLKSKTNKRVSPVAGLTRCLFILFIFIPTLSYAVSVTTLMSRSEQLIITETKTDELVGRFLITNPSTVAIKVFISFGNSCNIQHFTRSDKVVPLQKVTLKISGFADEVLWTRAGSDCSSALEWTPSGPFLDNYTVDIVVNWTAANSSEVLAGTYSESITVVAVEL